MNKISDNIKLVRLYLLARQEIVDLVGDRVIPFAFRLSSAAQFPFVVIGVKSAEAFDNYDVDKFTTRSLEIILSVYGDDPQVTTDLVDECIIAMKNRAIQTIDRGLSSEKNIFAQVARFNNAIQRPPRPSEGESPTTDFVFEWEISFQLVTST